MCKSIGLDRMHMKMPGNWLDVVSGPFSIMFEKLWLRKQRLKKALVSLQKRQERFREHTQKKPIIFWFIGRCLWNGIVEASVYLVLRKYKSFNIFGKFWDWEKQKGDFLHLSSKEPPKHFLDCSLWYLAEYCLIQEGDLRLNIDEYCKYKCVVSKRI